MDKLIFLHNPKTAGTFVRIYMNHLFRINGWEDSLYDGHSEHGPFGGIWRDFTGKEFEKIAERERGKDRPAFVHSHSVSYSPRVFRAFKREGWKSFTFVRDLGNILCSYFFYMKDFKNLHQGPETLPLSDDWNLAHWGVPRSVIEKITLDEFISIAVNRKKWKAISPFWEGIDYVLPYSNENFAIVLEETLRHKFEGKIPEISGYEDSNKKKILTSGNKGYEFYCLNEDISLENRRRVKEDWRQKVFEVIIERCN